MATRKEVSRAIHRCLARCYATPEKLIPVIAEFLEELRAIGTWTENDVRAVEQGVRKVLVFGVINGAAYPAEGTDTPPGDFLSPGPKTTNVNTK